MKANGVGACRPQRRLSDLPDVPTLAEAGFPGVGNEFWVGFFVPANTPREIVRRLHAAVLEVTRQAAVSQIFEKAQLPLAVSASPDEFRAFVKSETERYGRLIRENNLQF